MLFLSALVYKIQGRGSWLGAPLVSGKLQAALLPSTEVGVGYQLTICEHGPCCLAPRLGTLGKQTDMICSWE